MSKKKIDIANSVRSLRKWFSIDITIKLFGVTIVHWHYPPENEPCDDEVESIF